MNIEALRRVQKNLAERVIVRDEFKKPLTRIAGVDLAYGEKAAFMGCTVTDYPPTKVICNETWTLSVEFPYIPTLLGFREAPHIIRAISSLRGQAQLYIINSHGLAHPHYCGCASHIGVASGEATIGVAASNLCGSYSEEPKRVGEAVSIRYKERRVGWVFKSQVPCNPIFISPGHRVSLKTCLEIVKESVTRHKFPEPLSLAHKLANEEKRRWRVDS